MPSLASIETANNRTLNRAVAEARALMNTLKPEAVAVRIWNRYGFFCEVTARDTITIGGLHTVLAELPIH